MDESEVARLVREHVDAFNAHDTQRVLAGLAEDAVWRTGRATSRGREELREVFDEWLWGMAPTLELRTLLTGPDSAAAELTERLTHDGRERHFEIAAFFRFADALITEAVVYREGVADLV